MMFCWTSEPFGFALRDGNGRARATMVRNGEGFWGQIITRDMPDSGPYSSRTEAATWVARMLVHLELVPAESEFGDIPEIPSGKRAASMLLRIQRTGTRTNVSQLSNIYTAQRRPKTCANSSVRSLK